MAYDQEERFDLSYSGLIAPGADPDETRRRLAAVFKLTEKGAERLFTGKPLIVKRGVDAATAARFEQVFARAGAVLTTTPLFTQGTQTWAGDPEPAAAAPNSAASVGAIDTKQLSLAPLGGNLEEPPHISTPEFDIGYLSLLPGEGWSLEDCEPPPVPTPLLDLSSLALEPIADSQEAGDAPHPDRF